ncbi:MAG: RidA family protein [Bacteroidales bacterium]|nr:RidA family protein [Bacteroidales bacterium]
MTVRRKFSSGAPWEEIVGYSRAVRVGNTIEVTGTIALDKDGNSLGMDDPYVQTVVIIKIAEGIIHEAGGTLQDVIRTRIFVTDILQWEAVGRAHREFFGKIKPATTMVEVSALIRPEAMVEIEFTAVVD